jgi:hypothetical protein
MLLQWSERDLLARRNSSGFSFFYIYNFFNCSMSTLSSLIYWFAFWSSVE